MKILIRDASQEDIDALTTMMNQLGYPTSLKEMSERFERIYYHADYKTFVAIIDGQVAGMIGLTTGVYYELNGTYARILALVVEKQFRQKGIAKSLITAAEYWAKEKNATALLLNCGNREERETAHLFYQKNGFTHKSSGYIKHL